MRNSRPSVMCIRRHSPHDNVCFMTQVLYEAPQTSSIFVCTVPVPVVLWHRSLQAMLLGSCLLAEWSQGAVLLSHVLLGEWSVPQPWQIDGHCNIVLQAGSGIVKPSACCCMPSQRQEWFSAQSLLQPSRNSSCSPSYRKVGMQTLLPLSMLMSKSSDSLAFLPKSSLPACMHNDFVPSIRLSSSLLVRMSSCWHQPGLLPQDVSRCILH